MTSRSSSLPARLRRLLASEGAMSPGIKVDSECPPKIKALLNKVIQSPLQDIAIPLSGFRWEYNKGNFHHWGPLFLHFDTYFKTYLSNRRDLLLSDNIIVDDNPFPKNTVLQILRVMQIILENCPNKGSFSGVEHFKLLLSSTDPEVLIATLETLAALVKINPSKVHGNAKLIGLGNVNSCLLSLAQGWGSKEEGLGLYYCVMENEKSHDEGLCLFPSDTLSNDEPAARLGSTLFFDLHGVDFQKNEGCSSGGSSSTATIIHIPDMHLRKEDDLLLMKQCIDHYNVPNELRFSLLTRIRYTHAFRTPRISRLYTRICLLAFIVLVQSHDANDELTSFFANEPVFPNELIRIVRCEETIPGTIRTLAMQALGAQLASCIASSERGRILGGSSINFTGGNRMILLNVLQKAIISLNNSNDPSSLAFVEAILQFYLLHVISSSNNGGSIRGSGMVPTFLPLLEDSNPSHMHLICSAVKTLQKLMDFSHTAVSLFKSSGGVELLAQRLEKEVHAIVGLSGTDENSMVVGESSVQNADHLYIQKRLIKALLKALGSATYAPANSTRSENAHDSIVPSTLALIFRNVEKFGGDIYSSAVALMNEIIHKDPTCFTSLHDAGLPQAFLTSVVAGILPSSKALTCVPNGLGAICLNAKGLDAVKESSALRFIVDIFTLKKYAVAMNEGILPLANAVEELLRHVSSLRNSGVDAIIEIVNKIAMFCDDNLTRSSRLPSSSNAMETDTEDKVNDDNCTLVAETDVDAEDVSNDQFIQLSIFHVMVLVHRAIENTETCRLFVEKSGIEALLKLLLRPSIAQSSSGGMSIAVHSTMVFKGFTQHHSVPLARSFCSALKDQLKKALTRLQTLSGSFLLDPLSASDEVFTSLFILEFLLFLAASKDSRWVSALISEFSNGSRDVLVDIGKMHREMLWQIALLEDAKVCADENDTTVSAAEMPSSDSTSNENEDRLTSFRQFLDPLLRRRVSGWSAESQFFELMNLYRDLSRASLQQRLSPSNTRFSSTNPLQQSVVSQNTAAATPPNKDEKQSSYYASRCEIVRSLTSHISHLFQELGKAMVSPRRRDDVINVSSSSKLVVATFASIVQDHLAFGGHESSSSSEASISTKCRYLGKVIDFIDSILLERPDSCNPIVLNALYGQGVLHSILTTFEATSQLLFAVNRVPTSPMETDDGITKLDESEESDRSWIHGPLASYGKFMDHLVTSAYILTSVTKHLLCQSITSGDLPFPRDAETFVKVLQAMVLKAVLPVWTHAQFTDCSYNFITIVISIIKHVYSGVEVKTTGSSSARITGPPPNEAAISTIVEMGFSRSRAVEALRQVPGNRVELAMDWLFSHQEEVPEDDELARALAMSLGSSESETKNEVSTENSPVLGDEALQLPPVDQLLATCTKLLQMKESLAFPVRDLLVMLCSQNDGQFRSIIITFIIDQVKLSNAISGCDNSLLSALLHVLALIFHEDAASREVAVSDGFIKLTLELLSQWDSGTHDTVGIHVPKWVTTAFLAIDRLLQVDRKLNADISELLKKDDSSKQNSLVIDEAYQIKLQFALGLSPKYIDLSDQKRVIEFACNCMRKHLPSDNLHAVLQLCATLTRNHSVAVSFFEAGGVSLLLSLPMSSLFAGFDNIAASIIRHVLEDPQTLQQAMESEIRHSLVTANNRHSSGRISPRNFLLNLTSVISRDPVVFMQAAQSVCQVEMTGERPYIVLTKDREKDKSKEKEKDNASDKDKSKPGDGRVVLGNMSFAGTGNGHGKLSDSGSKNSKAHRKPPPSFTNTIELLLESVVGFVPPATTENTESVAGDARPATDMDVDISNTKGKGKVLVTVEEREAGSHETYTFLARTVFVLKLLTEVVTMYTSSIHAVLRRDTEISSCRGSHKVSIGVGGHGVLHHVLHEFLPCLRNSKKDKKLDSEWRHKLATRANQFIVACCVRSSEARKRVFLEISYIFNDFVDSCNEPQPPRSDLQAFVDLVNDVLAARSVTGSYISAEASATFIDVGLIKSLTQTLQVLNLDHADSSKVVTGIVKALECVTKEHVHSADVHAGKGDISKPADNDIAGRADDSVVVSHPVETSPQMNPDSSTADHVGIFSAGQIYDGSEAVTEDMEHDQDLDGGFPPGSGDDYMHESSEDARVLENGIDSVGIPFEIQPHIQENLDEDDEDMSGDDEDEVDDDEDEDEHNDLEEEEEDHHMPHPDTDQDDHEVDDDEFDEEVMEEDEDDDDDGDDGVILRLDESINGINVLDHIEVFGRDDNFGNDTLHVMPVEVFGSRRQGRTTSIYNLLGRNGDNPAPPRHPLLMEPSLLHSDSFRQSDNVRDVASDSASYLDTAYRSLRNVRHGQRVNLWADDNQQSGGSNVSIVPQGFEELLVSCLKRPSLDEAPDKKISLSGSQNNAEAIQVGISEATERTDNLDGDNQSQYAQLSEVVPRSDSELPVGGESFQATDDPDIQARSTDMQFEHNDTVVRDVEAISQESSGSGATLGESLRSLDVEIGSADGHDDGGDRQASADRIPVGDHVARPRRSNVSLGNSVSASGREASLHSLTEVSENPSQEELGASAERQPGNGDTESGPIDPAFLEALPAELRAEVLSAQQNQAPQPSNTEQPNTEEIDPEFLAALPPDIRAEVLAQQQAQRLHQSQELEGQPVEMDTVSIIATFPSDIRQEVLLTSSDAILANLTPALVAEANMLRERFAHRHHNRNLFGMYPRSRRGESSRRGEGSAFDRAGVLALRSSLGGKVVEADGAPLVDPKALESMIRILQVVQPLYKGPYQRLLLNLCAHSDTRKNLVKLLMNMLTIDIRKPVNQAEEYQPLYRLYSGQSHVVYSRHRSSDGIPPLLSRRILEVLTYLARNHPLVAKIMLNLIFPWASADELEDAHSGRGKAIIIEGNDEHLDKQQPNGYVSIVLLFSLLNQPLYLRSVVHLEHLLHLLEVVIENAENKSNSDEKSLASSAEQSAQILVTDTDMNVELSAGSSIDASSSMIVNDFRKTLASNVDRECDCASVLANLPQAELRLLCSLLAREGLSDSAYALIAEVVKKLAAIAPTHSQLFVTQLADAVQSLSKSAMDELHLYGESEEALLCASSSDGAAILRVLQALSSLVASLTGKEADHQCATEQERIALSQMSDINSNLEPLWLELSACISRIESYYDTSAASSSSSRRSKTKPSGSTPLPAGSQNILPYIESFFVMCEKLQAGLLGTGADISIAAVSDAEDLNSSANQHKPSSSSKNVEKHVAFVKFTERHKKLLNAFIRQNPGLLEKSFSLMLKVPRFIDFDNKRAHFRSKIKHQHDHHHSSFKISVRRAYILEDSYNQLRMRSSQDLKGRLTVQFQGEEGIDAGGLTREWYQLLSRVIFDKGALLFTTVGNDSTFQPNPNSVYQTEHLSYFKFVGRVVGKALFDGQLLDVHFTRSFYKHILGAKVTYHDIEAIDPDYFKNLKWMLENDISDILDLTFSIDADEEKRILYERNEVTDYELIPGGRNIKVTEENKHQYVDLVVEHRLTTAIRPQINAFLEGFNELIPRELISIFNDKELELLISGLPDIDLDDMRANTEYSGYSAASPVIQWFWEVAHSFSKEDKARFLQFVTGTSKVPLEGFSALHGISGSQKFQIHKAYGSPDHLPSAHTCFNQLDLPEYPSKQHLEERLLLAIHEGSEGFGFG
uniref:HECT-type E3 ubiquitin transferase n=1 Tax=Kalanchoe fedtschenkoi TaxID=63787 RepID=A0A7N0UIS5_KALFE